MLPEEQRGQSQDDDQAGDDEAQPAGEGSGPASQPPRTEDGQLRRRRPGQQVAGGDGVFELGGRHPLPVVHAQLAQESDVGRRAAEPDAPDPAPLTSDGGQANGLAGGLHREERLRKPWPSGPTQARPTPSGAAPERRSRYGRRGHLNSPAQYTRPMALTKHLSGISGARGHARLSELNK